MAGRNKTPLLGWHPPAELAAWARAEAERRGGRGALTALLTEALAAYRAEQETGTSHKRNRRG